MITYKNIAICGDFAGFSEFLEVFLTEEYTTISRIDFFEKLHENYENYENYTIYLQHLIRTNI